MNVLILAPLKEKDFQRIQNAFPDFHYTITKNQDLTQQMIDECDIIVGNPSRKLDLYKPNIKAIILCSAGSDLYVKEGLLHPDTILTNASGTFGNAIAEHAIGMILALNKNFKTYFHHMDQGLWQMVKTGKEIYHSTVVIIGLGDLGLAIAKRLKAFDCKIIGIKRNMCALPPYIDDLYTTTHLDRVLPMADFVISMLPQSRETIHMFDKKRFLLMKKNAVFINMGRGSAVCTEDLKEVLRMGHLYGVGLDVVEEEPLKSDDELWGFDNVIITPHASGGYVWDSTRHYYVHLVTRNLKHFLNHEALENEVDFKTGYRKAIYD